MIQKFHAIGLIVTGILLVIGLLIFRKDLKDTSSYSRKMRRLIHIGITAFTYLGLAIPISGCEADIPTDQTGLIEADDKGSVANIRKWQKFMKVWDEASLIAAGSKGGYPYTSKAKKELLEVLEEGLKDADGYMEKGIMNRPEGELFKFAVLDMIEDAGRFRTIEMKGFTCYMPMVLEEGWQSAPRLYARINLLKQLAEAKRVQAEVLEIVLTSMEDEIAYLEKRGDHRITVMHTEYNPDSILTEIKNTIGKIKRRFVSGGQELTDE